MNGEWRVRQKKRIGRKGEVLLVVIIGVVVGVLCGLVR